MQSYYDGLDFSDPRDVRRFLNVLSVFLAKMERQISEPIWGEPTGPKREFDEFKQQLLRDGYQFSVGVISPVTAAARLADAKAFAINFDAAHISDQIRRIESSIDTDPSLAIGTAKELVESCFRTVLKERGIDPGKEDLPQLGKQVFKLLKLVPDDVPEASRGAQTIRVLLSNLATVVQGIAEVRSLYGTGHGREGRTKGVSARHARLVVGAASALVTFVFETHREQASTAFA